MTEEKENLEPTDRFDFGLRLQGREMVGFFINSHSQRANWIIVVLMILVVLAALSVQMLPVFEYFWPTE